MNKMSDHIAGWFKSVVYFARLELTKGQICDRLEQILGSSSHSIGVLCITSSR